MGKRIIKIALSVESVNAAIKKLEREKVRIQQRVADLIVALTDYGVEIAKLQVASLGAFYTGELEASITGYFSPATGVGIIRASAAYAVYVEFGTGVVGAENPHPDPTGWAYDVNVHGDKGWVYYNERDGKWHWTQGMESRPFMYNTARELERECIRIAKEVFSR